MRILKTNDAWYVETPAGAARIETSAQTTGQLLNDRAAIAAATALTPIDTLMLTSPITTPCRVVAQMTNYVSHIKDAGMNPDHVPLTFFRKASASISGPYDDVVRPPHVSLLDYEAEIGQVIGREIPVGDSVTASDIAALVITNDLSARDVQLPQTQFYEAKSYPTFTPTGPALFLLDEGELKRFADLRLRLWVNGELRQDMTAADMLYEPLETLEALTRFQPLSPGDLILTGTPVGTALSAPPKPVEKLAALLPAATKWRLFFKAQARNPEYLKDGDVIKIRIATDDGAIDLGVQRTTVRWTR